MQKKNESGASAWVDPDDAPELTDEFFDKAEYYHGNQFLGVGRPRGGRPKSESPKEQISLRLDPDVLAKLREGGPGWQSRINGILRQALGIATPARPSSGRRRSHDKAA
jgi:uncharacterized protein (DUF4415 family)